MSLLGKQEKRIENILSNHTSRVDKLETMFRKMDSRLVYVFNNNDEEINNLRLTVESLIDKVSALTQKETLA